MQVLFFCNKVCDMKNLQSLKYTCLFGGGAIRGAAHVGVLKAFEELGIKYYGPINGHVYEKGKNNPVTFSDIDKKLYIISTNIKDFSCCEFSKSATPDFEIAKAVRISCCAPGLMRAVNIDDKLLVDGDLMKGRPMWSLSKELLKSQNRICEIRLEGEFEGDDSNPLNYVNGMYSCMTFSETSFIADMYGKNDKYDYLVINTGNVVVFEIGRASCRERV